MDDKPKVVYVSWTDWARGQKFLIDQHTQLRVERAAIPIIFVPGIMGSRLKRVGGARAWDPDDLPFMLGNFFRVSGAQREELLTMHPLEVNKDEAGGQPTASFRVRMTMKYTYSSEFSSTAVPPDWDWMNLPRSLSSDARLTRTIDTMIDHGWDQVAWTYYGDLLLKLADLNLGDLSRCFVHPIYACGYNWVDDNEIAGNALAKRIQEIIKKENFAHHPCDRVILVSHSMGGLVTRSCVLHDGGAMASTLGIVHGAQPATGAPAAYRRMRAGFEPPNSYNPFSNTMAALTNRVMGLDDARVVPVLAKCVGGLELLPTVQYRTNPNIGSGSQQWLTLTGKDGKQVCALPKSDPYKDIYTIDNAAGMTRGANEQFLALVPHPALLSPAPAGGKPVNRYSSAAPDAVQKFQGRLSTAAAFHDFLKLKVHNNTYVTYTGHGGPKTYDRVRFSYLRDENETRVGTIPNPYGGATYYEYKAAPETQGTGIDLDAHPPGGGAPQYFELQGQDGNGDGTVPVSSSSALIVANGTVQANNKAVCDEQGKTVSPDIAKVDHGSFFNNADAVKFTMMAIRQLDLKYRKLKIGF